MVRSPDGAIRIRIRPRLASPVSPRTLVERTIDTAFGTAATVTHAPVTQLVTSEGELAALASAQVNATAHATGVSVGIVGDEPCLAIEVLGAAHREYAVLLIRSLGLGLEAIRRRWFQYAPPPGWLGTRRDRATIWLHPAYPRTPTRVTVFDARPHTDAATEQLHRFLFLRLPDGLRPLGPLEVEDVTSDHGLAGRTRRVVGTLAGADRTLRMASVHADDRFAYTATIEGQDDPAVERTFRTLIASFHGVPHRPADLDVFAF